MWPAPHSRLRLGVVLFVAAVWGSVQPPAIRAQGNCASPAFTSPGVGFSFRQSLSADGRHVAFASAANNLVPGDSNGVADIFVFDRTTCAIERVSVNSAEEQADDASFEAAISLDGRFVAFQSLATNLGPTIKPSGFLDVFVRDRQSGVTLHASPAAGGGWAEGDSHTPAISGDGLVVAFWSIAPDLVASDGNGHDDLFVRDLQALTTTRVTLAPGGVESTGTENGIVFRPALSGDGRYLAYSSLKPDLVTGDGNGNRDVFRHDRQTGATVRVSVATGGAETFADSERVAMSDDGRYVAFDSFASNLAASDPDFLPDVFVHDVVAGATTHVSVNSLGMKGGGPSRQPAISGDGRYVTFVSASSLVVPGILGAQIFVRDRTASTTYLVSVADNGDFHESGASAPAISADARFVSFTSNATLLAGIGAPGVYVSDWRAGSAPHGVNLIQNSDFQAGQAWWTPFALPQMDDLVWNVTGGVLQFYRKTGSIQAVVLQTTSVPMVAFAPVTASFQLQNLSNVRKRITVLIHDRDFTDLSVCTFWLDPSAFVMQTYVMRTHTTRAWSAAAISFYAASADGLGFYGVDNVSLVYDPAQSDSGTECLDPTAPSPTGAAPGPDLIANGDFGAGLTAWTTFGQIVSQIAGGVFEFYRPSGTPAGVVLQGTGQAMTNDTTLLASFSLGNSSLVRKRVTVLVHDGNFQDLSACTFWLPPQLPLTTYMMRTFTTRNWTNATVSVYPATTDTHPWIRLDDVTLRRAADGTGTSCIEPDLNPMIVVQSSSATRAAAAHAPRGSAEPARRVVVDRGIAAPGGASGTTRLTLQLWVPPRDERVEIEITADGETWTTVATLERSEAWTLVDLDASWAVEIRVRPAR
jgi:Tol biopolymer transport system component